MIPYSLKVWVKKTITSKILGTGKAGNPHERLNPYSTDISMGRLNVADKRTPLTPRQSAGVMFIPGVTNTPLSIESSAEVAVVEPAKPSTPFLTTLRHLALSDISRFFDGIYNRTSAGKRRKRESVVNRAKREEFERLARGER